MVLAGSGRVDVNVTFTSKDECAAFHELDIGALFIFHFIFIIVSIR
jgi:hypothetical protein